MTAQGENPAAGPSNIAEQELKNRSSPDDLDAFCLLRPSDRVTNRCRLIGTGSTHELIRNSLKQFVRNAANRFNHFRRVTSEMAFELLKNATPILECQVAFRKTEIVPVIEPGFRIVLALLRVPS